MVRRSPLTAAQVDEIIFTVLELFFHHGMGPMEIAKKIRKDMGVKLNREAVYPLLRKAVELNYLQLTPPNDRVLANFFKHFTNKGVTTVVNTKGSLTGRYVAHVGADLTFDLIKEIAERRGHNKAVHIGFGIGRSTRELVQRLAVRLGTLERVPKLVVHAISPPYSVVDPMDNPLSALAQLLEVVPEIEYVPLAVSPIVNAKDYENVINTKIVKEAFDRAKEIDIVITSLADEKDAHGYLRRYLNWLNKRQIKKLHSQGWIGDLQLRPYGKHGSIPIKSGLRPVMLFEIEDLVKLAKRSNRHVVLLAAQCSYCGHSKASALLPLLKQQSLHVWTHLVLDSETASAVMSASA